MKTELPTLYKLTKTGKVQEYKVSTSDNIITVTQGQVEGKKQDYLTTCIGVNIGKSNETTPTQQAVAEAQSKWNRKKKSGYVLDSSGETQVKLPQKVKNYFGNEKNVKYPCYVSTKLNGVNGTYWLLDDDSLKLTSRGGDEYPPIPHLEESIRYQMRVLETTCLNGELYIHGQHLQDIQSAVKVPKGLSKQLQFVLFEMPLMSLSYDKKAVYLNVLSDKLEVIDTSLPHHTSKYLLDPYVTSCTTIKVKEEDDLETLHFSAVNNKGCEGLVITNADSVYKFNERSSNVFKYKRAKDAEFKITGFKLDKNLHPVIELVTPEGLPFKAKAKGTAEEKISLASILTVADFSNLHGTIEYETLSKALIPLKPIFLNLRSCSVNGVPLE